MTAIQAWAIALYGAGAVFAIWGPGIAAVRLWNKYRAAKASGGTWNDFDAMFAPGAQREGAFRDAVWGIVEFGGVSLGVVLASVASIMLVVESSALA